LSGERGEKEAKDIVPRVTDHKPLAVCTGDAFRVNGHRERERRYLYVGNADQRRRPSGGLRRDLSVGSPDVEQNVANALQRLQQHEAESEP
jgi:hypothetical protein